MIDSVIVTGGGQGIGRRIALTIAARGGGVCIADTNEERGSSVVEEIGSAGGKAVFAKCDVSSFADCEAAVAAATESFGSVNGIVNNAAIFSTLRVRPFWEIPEQEWDLVMAVNLKGIWQMCRAALPRLREAENASIVNMSSSTVMMGRQNYAHYVGSKAGVIGLSRAMAREVGGFNIRVNALTPGPVFTEIPRATVTPEQQEQLVAAQCLKRPGAPEDIASVVGFLLSPESRFMTGQTVNVDGGMMHI